MRVLVTGAAGFIGSNLAAALSAEATVVGLDNFLTGSWENLRDFRGDLIAGEPELSFQGREDPAVRRVRARRGDQDDAHG